jgi:hypothetical protein
MEATHIPSLDKSGQFEQRYPDAFLCFAFDRNHTHRYPPNRIDASQMERKFLSSETANALKTIRNIIEKFPDYGVVDLFGMYR